MPINVLHIVAAYKPAYGYGGPIRSISNLCQALNSSGVSVNVLTTRANGKYELDLTPGKEYIVDGISVRYFNRWTKDHSQFSPGLLVAVFRGCKKYNVVHIHSWWNLVSVFSLMICLFRNIRPVVSIRGTLSGHTFTNKHQSGKNIFHSWVGRRLLSKAILHVTSEKEATETHQAVPTAKIVTIPNIFELPNQKEIKKTSDHSILKLIFVGRIDPVKNLELLLEAIKLMNGEIKYQLNIIGTGEKTYIEGFQQKYRYQENIHWLGEKEGNEKFELMREADALVLISHTENFGNVVIEALSQGTAVIVSKSVGISTYIQKNNFGWVIDPTIESLSAILKSVALDTVALENIRLHAPERIYNDFNTLTLVTQYARMYEESLATFSGNKN